MVDLQTQYEFIKDQVDSSVLDIFKNGTFINGPTVKDFQNQLEKYLNVNHVIPCANGTDALQIALMSLDLQPGDEIITSDFTFAATVEVIALLKLKPVLVDIDEDTFNIDCNEIAKAILNLKTGKPSKIPKKAANTPAKGKQIQKDQPKVVAINAYPASIRSRAMASASAMAGAEGRPRRLAVSPSVATASAARPPSSAWAITVRPRSPA